MCVSQRFVSPWLLGTCDSRRLRPPQVIDKQRLREEGSGRAVG